MRETPTLWRGRERVQWACVLMELLGEKNLEYVPLLMSGLRNVETSPTLHEFEQVIRTAREIMPHYTTRRALTHAVGEFGEYRSETGKSGSYHIDPKTLTFERLNPLLDPNVRKAEDVLQERLPYRKAYKTVADIGRSMSARPGEYSEDEPVPIDLRDLNVPSPPRHDTDRVPSGPIEVPIAGLISLAEELDRTDEQNPGWRPGNWKKRLTRARLMSLHSGGLRETDALKLDGLKHLLGLPGSGKTTLLILMSLYLAREGYRSALFFTSIEVARQYMETLVKYGGNVGMLVGQSPMTRATHANNIAEIVAAEGDRGFAHTVFGADLFSANCVLPAFSPGEGSSRWRFGDAPCDRILQRTEDGKLREHLCPLWSACGRNKAPRDLTGANIWVGHVRSMDTRVPQQAAEEQFRYFEIIAKTFDVVVFDECDMTQKMLDEYGAADLSLSGAEGSLHQVTEDQVLERLAGEDNHRLFEARNVTYARQLAEFGTHNHALVHTLHVIEEAVVKRYENQLLTTNRIITELLYESAGRLFKDDESPEDRENRRKKVEALCEFWDSGIYSAFYDRNDLRSEEWDKAALCARVLGIETDDLLAQWDKITRSFRAYLAEDTMAGRSEILTDIENLFLEVAFRHEERPKFATDTTRLLTAVSFMILAYKRIVFAARELVAQNLLREPLTGFGVSRALQRTVPVNALGALSGVRYRFEQTRAGTQGARTIRLGYLVVNGAPRMLMHRFHELQGTDEAGPNVLLTSATSYLEASPAYHVAHGPHYVLSPKEQEYAPEDSQYYFRPVYDRRTGEALRFSGAGLQARKNLEIMLEELVQGGPEKAEIYRQINSFDVRDDVRRKAAIVVNSYEQVRQLKTYLDRRHPQIGERTVGVVRSLLKNERQGDYVTTAQVEKLGDNPQVDILIFPMLALNRGVNIVFTRETRRLQAAIGNIYFLTRPHPNTDDLGLLLSLAARATQEFDTREFPPGVGLADMAAAWRKEKTRTYRLAARLLQEPLMASRLGGELFRAFTANQMVPVLQTIGRGMRGGSPVQVFFVDAAWAPESARGETDRARSSMIVMMRDILEKCVRHPDPAIRETYSELYGPFLEPLRDIRNIEYPATFDGIATDEDETERSTVIGPNTYMLEDPDEFDAPLVPDTEMKIPDFDEVAHD